MSTAGPAAADPFVVAPCQRGQIYDISWIPAFSNWRLVDNCVVDELVLEPVYENDDLWSATWSIPGSPRLQVTEVSLDLLGSDGSDGGRTQGVEVCDASNTCSPLLTPSGPNVTSTEHHTMTVGDGQIPLGANYVRIIGRCPSGSCEAGAPLKIRNLRITFDGDTVKPTIELSPPVDDPYAPPPPNPSLKLNAWNTGTREISFTAQDEGSGVMSIETKSGFEGIRQHEVGCGYPGLAIRPHLCDPFATYTKTYELASTQLSSFGLQQGDNELRAWAVDAAGNRSEPFVSHFKIDYVSPVITNLRATTATTAGWQPGQYVDLEWTNLGESEQTATQSGVTMARYNVFSDSSSPTVSKGGALIVKDAISSITGIRLPGAGSWRITVQTWDRAGNRGDTRDLHVGVDSQVPDAPAIGSTPVFGMADLTVGANVAWSQPANLPQQLSGICGFAYSFDRSPLTDPGVTPQLPGSASSVAVPSYLPDGTNYLHLRAVSCAGVAGQVAHAAIKVDAAPPVIRLSAPGPSGWYDSEHPFSVTVRDESGLPLTASIAVDGVPGEWQDGEQLEVELADGRHSVLVRAKDSFGNESERIETVRVDNSPPTAMFVPAPASDPRLVSAVVSDPISGVAGATLDYRRLPQGEWMPLGTTLRPTGFSGGVELTARFPDESLPAGSYELRVIAYDTAGHVSVSGSRIDGLPAVITLPLRGAAELNAALRSVTVTMRCHRRPGRSCKKVKRGTWLRSLLVEHGRQASLGGTLRDQYGDPIEGAALEVFETSMVGGPTLVATPVTDKNGRYEFLAKPGVSRRLTVRFPGSATLLPTDAAVRLLVKSSATLSVSFKKMPKFTLLRFRGRVIADGAVFPAAGKRIEIQSYLRGSWRSFSVDSIKVDGRSGRFIGLRTIDNPPKASGGYSLRFRAFVPSEAGWPYESGWSRPVSIKLR